MKNRLMRTLQLTALIVVLTIVTACGGGESVPDKASGNEQSTTTVDLTDESSSKTDEESSEQVNEEVKITWLTSQGKFRDVYKEMAAQLKEDENITVEFQVIPDDQYFTLIKAKLATGEVPDVLEVNVPSNNSEINAIENCVDLSNEPWVARLVNPGLLNDPVNDKIYAMPRESSSAFMTIYYNKAVFDELSLSEPTTYDEFLDICETVKNAGITPIFASDKDSWVPQIWVGTRYPVALHPNDSDTWNKLLTNELKWSDIPEFKEVLAEYLELYEKGYMNKDNLSATFDNQKEALATGKAAMAYNGEWMAQDIKSKWPEVELGSFVIPYKDKQMMAIGAYVQGLFVPNKGTQIEETKRFLDLWSQPKYQNMMYEQFPGFPAFNDVEGGDVIPAVQELVDEYIATGNYTYQMNDPMTIISPILPDLWKLYVEAIAGQKTPEEVFKAWDLKYSDFMQQKEQPGF